MLVFGIIFLGDLLLISISLCAIIALPSRELQLPTGQWAMTGATVTAHQWWIGLLVITASGFPVAVILFFHKHIEEPPLWIYQDPKLPQFVLTAQIGAVR